MPSPTRPYPTIGVIAAATNQPIHRIRYIVKARGIQAVGRAGAARIFSEADIERIRSELALIDRAKGVDRGLGA